MANGQNAALTAAITNAAMVVLQRASNSTQSGVDTASPSAIRAVAKEVTQEVQLSPEYRHLASTETSPWQSRAWWSRNVSLAAPLLAGFIGYTLPSDYNEVIAGVLWAVANLVAAYLAQRARTATRPLGE